MFVYNTELTVWYTSDLQKSNSVQAYFETVEKYYRYLGFNRVDGINLKEWTDRIL